jgi:hypothetical protein
MLQNLQFQKDFSDKDKSLMLRHYWVSEQSDEKNTEEIHPQHSWNLGFQPNPTEHGEDKHASSLRILDQTDSMHQSQNVGQKQ